jgi:hypothetical protein
MVKKLPVDYCVTLICVPFLHLIYYFIVMYVIFDQEIWLIVMNKVKMQKY